ncbi:DUF732 domain-containing protein [Mycolicibacterium elephantis]|uniref:DUF732 domain-containing protein n=1 Tax=Mycolicibacterium elephantis TaxID=81858 RepID=UPI003A89E422
MQQAGWRTAGVAQALLVSATFLLTGCSGDGVIALSQPDPETATVHGHAGAAPPGPPAAGGKSNALVVTDRQRAYLDALSAAGVKPSSDLMALNIGSYVCQARAAKHGEQAVWDIVHPLVRSDAGSDPLSATPPSAAEVDAATADYIRIATQRLC